MRKWLRRAKWLFEQIEALFGILLWLALVVLLLPLVPLFRAFEHVRGLYEDDAE